VEEDGTVQEVKTAASASALPPGVQSAIKDKYPLFQSSLVEKSRRPDGTYYEIEGSDGTSRWELEIMDDGSHLEAKRLGQGD
jgi:hypothetical protein